MKKISVFIIILGILNSIFSWSIVSAEAEVAASQSASSDYSLKQNRAVEQTGKLVFNIQNGDTYAGISGAYFTVTSSNDPQDVRLVKTDQNGQTSIDLPIGNYLIKQVGTTDVKENYTFTSIGFSRLIEAGQTVQLVGYERKLAGEYAFGNSPEVVHVPQNSVFDPSVKTQGIEAFSLKVDGTLGLPISIGQTYAYYNNVDTSTPGEYVSIYMARQASFSANTTHVLKVIVDPAAPVAGAEVSVHYVDENGQEIHAPQPLQGALGEAYDTANEQYRLTLDGYTLDDTQLPANEQGTFTDQEQIVTYIYKKNPVQVENVKVQYVDQAGQEIHAPQLLEGMIGEAYDTANAQYRLTIDGYTLDNSRLPLNEQGTFTDQEQIVTYVYTKEYAALKAQPVVVYYVDQEGKKIHDPQVITGSIGEKYNTAEQYRLNIVGYHLDETKLPANEQGTFSEQEQLVIYEYTRNAPKVENSSNQSQKLGLSHAEKNSQLPKAGESHSFDKILSVSGLFLLTATVLVYHKKRVA